MDNLYCIECEDIADISCMNSDKCFIVFRQKGDSNAHEINEFNQNVILAIHSAMRLALDGNEDLSEKNRELLNNTVNALSYIVKIARIRPILTNETLESIFMRYPTEQIKDYYSRFATKH